MNRLNTYVPIGAALFLGAAGIAGLIDPTMMIILVVVLTAGKRNRRGRCFGAWRA